MKTIITPTRDIPQDMLEQIKASSPREGLQSQLGDKHPEDHWVNFAQNQTAGYIEDDGKLVSFAVIGQDELFNMNVAKQMGLSDKQTALLMYLFTTPTYQQQGYAKQLIDALGGHAKEHLAVESLIRTTGTEKLKNLYLAYGAELYMTVEGNAFIEEVGIENDFYFRYRL